jgi:hypothetical protein
VIIAQFLLAGGFCLGGAAVFWGLQTVNSSNAYQPSIAPLLTRVFYGIRSIASDARFCRYLQGCFLFGFSGLLCVSFIPAFLSEEMRFGYLQLALLIHIIPSLASLAVTGAIGRWFDRSNPLVGWRAVRLSWGLEPFVLIAAPMACAFGMPAAFLVCAVGRVCRGAVMGGSWVLWWQIGVNYFAPPGGDTCRYQAILTVLNGVMRLTASAVGAILLTYVTPAGAMATGGLGVIISGLHAWAQARSDYRLTGFRTFADMEAAAQTARWQK